MNGKYIIALCGEDHSGKTETIQRLIMRLGLEREPRKPKDWIAHGKYKDIDIAAHCGGDHIKNVIEELKPDVENGVQIIITAVHPGSRNIGALQATFKDYTVVEFLKFKMPTVKITDPDIEKLFKAAWGVIIAHYVDVLLDFIDSLIGL